MKYNINNFMQDISPINGKRRSTIFKDKNKSNSAAPQRRLSEHKTGKPLYELKDKFRCIFCGGETCKHEDWTRNLNTVMQGLNCDQITHDLYAAQRPSTILIEEYNLIKTFHEYL